jgi:hypothetical protein
MDVRNIIALAVTLPSDREIVMTRVFDAPPGEGVAGRNFHGPVLRDVGTRDPEPTLRSILQPLGLDFDPRQLASAEAEKQNVVGITSASTR